MRRMTESSVDQAVICSKRFLSSQPGVTVVAEWHRVANGGDSARGQRVGESDQERVAQSDKR
jgi:hypothetical protein